MADSVVERKGCDSLDSPIDVSITKAKWRKKGGSISYPRSNDCTVFQWATFVKSDSPI